ncbi:sensor histidine kinase [Desulfobotulus sp.]|uniref:sensor histidine kinase n=1 Tax=Desulfobotulus sp. TaxID=1940337 RepID=UPI002A35A9F5|nr:ATP-binding protein [Desulfobotulus sp.]MDY0163583.1 ATP-binding protein [Desulfobotulus sp.]
MKHPPMGAVWKANLLVIAILILTALSYYYWQLRQASRTFSTHVQEHVEMVALAIRMNADRAILSQKVMEEILTTFLGNTARFVDFLDGVEPFSNMELAAFAREAGLKGIRIERDGSLSEGPEGWYPLSENSCRKNGLLHLEQHHLYMMTLPGENGSPCIQVALEDHRLAVLGYRMGLENLMEGISRLSDIRYIRMEPRDTAPSESSGADLPIHVTFEGEGEERIAHARMPMEKHVLLVGMTATPFSRRIRQLGLEFWAFTVVIVGLGGLFSWLLKRFHETHVREALRYEQELATEKEHATLGRASAAITHEIRNPLNAISMGIQRLRLESRGLQPQDHTLLDAMGEAVRRTDTIVAELKRYASPLSPRMVLTDLSALLDTLLVLYRPLCGEKHIRVHSTLSSPCIVETDPDLMTEVFENLLKNAIEAQPEGGVLHIAARPNERQTELWFENPGLILSPEGLETLLAPYVTTKSHGSGLGLSIAVRILRAHGGHLDLHQSRPGWLGVRVCLPLPSQKKKSTLSESFFSSPER